MIDLLEKSDKQLINAEYRSRYLCAVAYSVWYLTLIALITVGAFYAALKIQNFSVVSELAKLEKVHSEKGISTYSDDVKTTNEMLAKLVGDKSSLRRFSSVINELTRTKPKGIRLASISLDKTDGKWKIRITGFSSHRNDIISYVNELKTGNMFSEIESPFSNLVKEKQSDFTLSLALVPK